MSYLPMFTNDVIVFESFYDKPGMYITMLVESILPDDLGRIIGIKWIGLFDSEKQTFSYTSFFELKKDDKKDDKEITEEHIMNAAVELFKRRRNIFNSFPGILYYEDYDKDGYCHYSALHRMAYSEKKMNDEEFLELKAETTKVINKRIENNRIEQERKKTEQRGKRLMELAEFSKSLDSNKGYDSLKWKASSLVYRGDHYKGNMIMEFCKKNYPEEFNPSDSIWKSIHPICREEGCLDYASISMKDRKLRGCTKHFMDDDSNDAYMSFCLEHNRCTKCNNTHFWADKICQKCDEA